MNEGHKFLDTPEWRKAVREQHFRGPLVMSLSVIRTGPPRSAPVTA